MLALASSFKKMQSSILGITPFYLVCSAPDSINTQLKASVLNLSSRFPHLFTILQLLVLFLKWLLTKWMSEWHSLGWVLIPLLFSLFWPWRNPSSPHGHLLPPLCCCSAFAAAQCVILGNWSDWRIILPKLCCFLFPHSALPYGCTNGYVSSRERMMQGWKQEARLRSGSGMLC